MIPFAKAMIEAMRLRATELRPPFRRSDGEWQIYEPDDPAGEPSYAFQSEEEADHCYQRLLLTAALRALLGRGPTERMKKACGVYEAVATDVLRAQLTQLIAELEEK